MNRHAPATAAAEVRVRLDERSYDILIGRGLLAAAGERIRPLLRRPVTAIVTDETVAGLHLAALEGSLAAAGIASRAVVLPPGEATKCWSQLARLCDERLAAGIERSDHIVAFGGGVIGDLAGFAAAVLRRGVGFVQVPTTLLAQVDSSVGGKTGINSAHGKNLIGAFHQPALVIADTGLLDTLPPRELAAGYAEVAKYGLLGDAAFFAWLEANLDALLAGDEAARVHAVRTSCAAKAAVVAEDEREAGRRALLNLGHTFGHALEAATGYSQTLLHGEAVAIGMVLAFRYSQRCGLCPAGTAERVAGHLGRAGLPTSLAALAGRLPGAAELVAVMRQDKKAEAGRLTFILARGIGEAFVERAVDEAEVARFLAEELDRT